MEKLDEKKADTKTVEALAEDMNSVRKALYTVAGSVLVAALLTLFTIIQVGGPA